MSAPAGIGLRAPHLVEFDRDRPPADLLEIHAENYLLPSPSFAAMERVRADYRFSIHAVGLSLGAIDGLDGDDERDAVGADAAAAAEEEAEEDEIAAEGDVKDND